jgi:hypothetical protein
MYPISRQVEALPEGVRAGGTVRGSKLDIQYDTLFQRQQGFEGLSFKAPRV